MARSLVVTSKFLSVAGLGLLSSSALTLSTLALPSLLALPSPSDALPAYYKLKQHVAFTQRLLSISTGTLIATAYVLSPRFARHPFLIYMGLTVGVASFGVPRLLKVRNLETLDDVEVAEEGRGRSGAELRINGEVVRESIDGWRQVLGWQSLAWGVGWAMGTVGLWGDGY